MADVLNFVLVALAVWRITHMITEEDGPFDLLSKLRHLLGVKYLSDSREFGVTWIARGILCHNCVSFWIGFLGAVFLKPANIPVFIILGLSLSAASIFINSVLDRLDGYE